MVVFGPDYVRSMLASDGYLIKLVANESGVYFFPHTTEHRDALQPGLRYADDSAGNALAAMVKPGRIDFRFHRDFSDQRVRNLARRILDHPELAVARSFAVTYQGRTLFPGVVAD
jgi:hypothetical protein